MQSDSKILNSLYKIFEIIPQDLNLFEKALTHGSYTKEKNIASVENYERLEFLGDAVLKLCISDILYKKFPNHLEGDLTKIRSIIVSDSTLAELTKRIGLDSLIIIGKQEEKMGGRNRQSILACVFEAILGAYYLEGKLTELSRFLEKNLEKEINNVNENFGKFNAKAMLQEYTQAKTKETPFYNVVDELGPQHDKVFVIEVSYENKILATGRGKTKREAEQIAAYEACLELGVIK